MARPKKEGMDYFPHDTDAVNDEKIEALRFLYGNDGYAFYFILLERIYRSKDFELEVSDAETIQILSRKIAINPEVFNQILNTALKKGCFDKDEYEKRGVLTSEGIKKRASVVVGKRVKMRKEYHSSKGSEDSGEVYSIVSAAETEQKQGKENKTKQNKTKDKKDISDDLENAFNEFWAIYPKKADKQAGMKAFKKAVKNHDAQIIIDGTKKYAADCQAKKTDKQYIKNPATFLNAESYLNDFDTSYSQGGQARTGNESLFAQGAKSKERSEKPWVPNEKDREALAAINEEELPY